MPRSNYVIAEAFVIGATKGESSRMTIRGDKLYSYNSCIAIRKIMPQRTQFIISNRARFLGGHSYSCSTSRHIGCVHNACEAQNANIHLVDGWAEEDKPQFYVPELPTHKTVGRFFRSFNNWNSDCWTGKWIPQTGTKVVEWRFDDTWLYAPDGTVVAKREIVGTRQAPKETAPLGFKYYPLCTNKCDVCPAKFMCLTDSCGFFGKVFFIASGKYEKLAKKYLSPAVVLDEIPSGNIIQLDNR